MKQLLSLLLFLFLLILVAPVSGNDNLKPFTLDNGLELYIFKDDTVPLVNFQITFRTGAIVENEDFNGLSHLYEHMLFKANDEYKSQEEFDAALNEMGSSQWNGGTSTEYVTYWSTVPYHQLGNIIKFWAVTVRTNKIDQAELEKEKQVVTNEIKMDSGDPQRSFFDKLSETLFEQYYSRKDVGGSVEIVQSCTPEKLMWLKKTYYVPNNCAIFLSGDVSPAKAKQYVEKYFGDWSSAEDPYEKYPVPKHPQLEKNKRLVVRTMPAPNFFIWGLEWRGPDVMDEEEDTYAADVLSFLLNRQSGPFLGALEPYIWQKESTELNYMTQRSGGIINLLVQLVADKDNENNKKMVASLKKAVLTELEKIANNPNYFSQDDIAWAISYAEAQNIYQNEKIDQWVNSVSFWWAVSSAEYYQHYMENLRKITGEELSDYVKRYMIERYFVEYFWINNELAEAMGLEDEL